MDLRIVTPGSRKKLVAYGVALILMQPLFTVAHYAWNEAVKPYPAYADSLAVPIFSEILFWLLLAPFAVFIVIKASGNYKRKTDIFDKHSLAQRYASVNVVFGLLVGYALLQLLDVFAYANLPMLIDVVLSVYLILAVRAVVIADWHRARSTQ